jgi:hypothetical protein
LHIPQCADVSNGAQRIGHIMIILLEDNARLRALVTRLSSLVIKQVVDQK